MKLFFCCELFRTDSSNEDNGIHNAMENRKLREPKYRTLNCSRQNVRNNADSVYGPNVKKNIKCSTRNTQCSVNKYISTK